jgi:hypothetical protein
MIPVYAPCPRCLGDGGRSTALGWDRCLPCDGIGRAWAPGAPAYDCTIILADRVPGEIVTLGTGEQARILWHMPREDPDTTFLGFIEPFTDIESHRPMAYPSCIGVRSVDVSRASGDKKSHDRSRSLDLGDPVHRQVAGRLM